MRYSEQFNQFCIKLILLLTRTSPISEQIIKKLLSSYDKTYIEKEDI